MYARSPFQVLNQLANFHEIWYRRYAAGRLNSLIVLNYQQFGNSMDAQS
jgi:hypothetical protein